MELVSRYFNKGIEGMSYESLKTIFSPNYNPGYPHDVIIKFINNGVIVLSDHTIIKCVKNYYSDLDGNVCKKNSCYGVLSHFSNHKVIDVNNCTRCHLEMIHDLSEKRVKRIYK